MFLILSQLSLSFVQVLLIFHTFLLFKSKLVCVCISNKCAIIYKILIEIKTKTNKYIITKHKKNPKTNFPIIDGLAMRYEAFYLFLIHHFNFPLISVFLYI